MVATAAWRRSEGLEVQPSSLHSHFVHISEQNADDFVVMPDPGTGAHLFAASSFRGLLEAVTLQADKCAASRIKDGLGRSGRPHQRTPCLELQRQLPPRLRAQTSVFREQEKVSTGKRLVKSLTEESYPNDVPWSLPLSEHLGTSHIH